VIIVVLNVHAPTEAKTDDMKGSSYYELERVFDKFPKYQMKMLFGDFNAKVGRRCFQTYSWEENLHKISMIMELE
jgi:hypothetical protein